MNVDRADQVQRIATPIVMVLAVLLASLCSSTGCSGYVVEDEGDQAPERAPGRDPRPSGGDDESSDAGDAGATTRADAGGSGTATSAGSEETGSGPGPEEDGSASSSSGLGDEGSTGGPSGEAESSSSGDPPAENHCDAACEGTDAQFDANVTACICAPQCLNNDWCTSPDECLDGRCAIRCDPLDDDCPGGMVCGMMPWNSEWACMWIGETP